MAVRAWIAAAQAEIGLVGKSQILLGISDGFGHIRGRGALATGSFSARNRAVALFDDFYNSGFIGGHWIFSWK